MIENLPQLPELPDNPRPIVVLGAGGIVRDAHLPAYRIAGFDVRGIYDLGYEKATALATEFGIPSVSHTLEEAIALAPSGSVFDVAVPASAIMGVLELLPDGALALIQKPMGEDLLGAKRILDHCNRHRLTAAVNFQMRYAPYVRLARELIEQGTIGDLQDIEIRITTDTPWHLWSFLEGIPRMEILYHSIHYLDIVRAFCGEPQSVYAKTMGHPRMPQICQVRSTIILDYGERVRATVTANHTHGYGPRHQESYIKWEGTKGAIKATMGLNLDYPRGRPDTFEFIDGSMHDWRSVPLQGSWFPHAFIGPMSSLMRLAEGADAALPTSVDEAYKTMAVVEAAYLSSERGGTEIPSR